MRAAFAVAGTIVNVLMRSERFKKYVKPASLSWWGGIVPLCIGCFIATEPFHKLTDWAVFARNAAGAPAPVLINLGIVTIGLRGKDG